MSCKAFSVLWTALFAALVARAHDPGLSTATVRLGPEQLEAVLVFSMIDTREIIEIDLNHDGQLSKEELSQGAAALQKMAGQALEVAFDGQTVQPDAARCRFDEADNATVYLSYPVKTFTNLVVRSKWLALMQPGHRQFFSLQNLNGDVLAERLLSANSDSVTVDMNAAPSPGSRSARGWSSFTQFLLMGVKHIWTGYDHLLFLFGLLIVTRDFPSSVKIITCFTIAHSLTLAVATLDLIKMRTEWVEPMIAATIVYVGIENIWRHGHPKGRWLLTFAFGLIHGFGFASALRERGVGQNGDGIALPLISFNLGVEVGQIVIAALALPLIWKLSSIENFSRRWVPAASIIVALLGTYWFVQRVWFGT